MTIALQTLEDVFKKFAAMSIISASLDDSAVHDRNSAILFEHPSFGFQLERKSSRILRAGNGIFLKRGGIKPGQLVSLYPGTIYMPGDATLIQSFNNRYLLRCNDGQFCDAKPFGLSASIYRSLDKEQNYPGVHPTCDATWLGAFPKNPLAVGHIINNGSRKYPPNVAYQELDIPTDFPDILMQYIPNATKNLFDQDGKRYPLRSVALFCTRPAVAGDELYSTYNEMV